MERDLAYSPEAFAAANATALREYLDSLTPERAARELEGLLAMRGEWVGRETPTEEAERSEREGSAPAVREAPLDLVPDAFRAIAACLDDLRISYALIGGIAASLQGQPRYTSDVDLVIAMPAYRLQELAQSVRERGFTIDPELVRGQWLASGFGRIWYGAEGTGIAVDLMTSRDGFLKSLLWRAEAIRFAGIWTRMASPEDVILLKSMAWRALDIGDAELILLRKGPRIDREYLRTWAADIAASREDQRDLPARIEALLGDGPFPPHRRA